MTKEQIKARYTLAFLGYLPIFMVLLSYYVKPMIEFSEPNYAKCDVYHHNAPPNLRCGSFDKKVDI